MKKTIYTTVFVSLVSVLFAQTNKTTSPKPAATTTPLPIDDTFCKQWKYISGEEFAVAAPATDKQKNDKLSLTCDKKAVLIKEGETKNGTWNVDKNKTYLTISVEGTKEQFRFKILKMEAKQLIVEWQDVDLVRHKMMYESN